jgi:hypothetical protein
VSCSFLDPFGRGVEHVIDGRVEETRDLHAALGGHYSDLSSVVSARADERQTRITLQATQLAGMTMFITAIIGAVTLTGSASARPFQFLAAVYAVTLIAGMLSYWAGGHRQQES